MRGLHKGEAESLQVALERQGGCASVGDSDIFHNRNPGAWAENGLIQLPVALAKLQQTSFFISPDILTAALERDKQRQKKV